MANTQSHSDNKYLLLCMMSFQDVNFLLLQQTLKIHDCLVEVGDFWQIDIMALYYY